MVIDLENLCRQSIDMANDRHLASETSDEVNAYFNGLYAGSLLEGQVRDLWIYLDRGDRLSLLGTALTLKFLVHHLRTIHDIEPKLHGSFKSKAKRVNTYNDYYGIRMEIKTAAVMASRGVKFSKHERPDFLIHGDFEGVGVECTSVHYSKDSGGVITPKIVGAIRKKSQKPYASRSIVVHIDITNVMHNGFYYMYMPTQEELYRAIDTETQVSKIGAVVISQNIIDCDARSIQSVYSSFRNPCISPALNRLISVLFPSTSGLVADISTTPLVP